MNSNTKYEVMISLIIVCSATICVLVGVISALDYKMVIALLVCYVVGRLNHRDTRQAIQDFIADWTVSEDPDPIYVALSGKAGCGKSTIAKQLVDQYGFVRYSFAAKVKGVCYELFPEIMEKPKEEHRWLLQIFGTEMCRSIDPLVWVKYLLRRVTDESYRKAVVDDCRFLNEFTALKELGFIMVRIERDKELLRKWGYNVDDLHPSEIELDNAVFNIVIQNDGPYPFDEAVEELIADLGLE